MCAVSAVMDNWNNNFKFPLSPINLPGPVLPGPAPLKLIPDYVPTFHDPTEYVTKEEFDKLKREFEAFKKLLLAAKEYDEDTNQPNCEMEEKVAMVRKVADILGVNVDDVFGKPVCVNVDDVFGKPV